MNKIRRCAIYTVGTVALLSSLVIVTEIGNRIVDTGKLTSKGQRDVYKQRDLYKRVKESENERYNNLWYQLTAEPGLQIIIQKMVL